MDGNIEILAKRLPCMATGEKPAIPHDVALIVGDGDPGARQPSGHLGFSCNVEETAAAVGNRRLIADRIGLCRQRECGGGQRAGGETMGGGRGSIVGIENDMGPMGKHACGPQGMGGRDAQGPMHGSFVDGKAFAVDGDKRTAGRRHKNSYGGVILVGGGVVYAVGIGKDSHGMGCGSDPLGPVLPGGIGWKLDMCYASVLCYRVIGGSAPTVAIADI